MKLPLSWLAEFVTIDADAAAIADRFTMAGLVIETIERLRPSFAGVVVAKVLKVERHPNADRLSLCEVDAGADRLSIVCGAPNVKAGMIAPLARVGARLAGAAAKGDRADGPLRLEDVPPLEAAVIRGVRSEGMLCSERELGFSGDHGGIMALDADAPIGTELASYLGLTDTVLDIEITPNRGDCLSILGLAREASALFGVPLKPRRLRQLRTASGEAPIQVELAAADLCPRYAALAMTKIKFKPSPHRIRRRLELCGMRALNNIVDITNYVNLELGQPLHAFDLAKIEGGKIVVRRAGSDREFVTLDNVPRALQPSDLMIADGVKALAIGGVMGGLNSEVGEGTREILLESAYFDPIAIARTARRLGLRSEASYRFERGIDRDGQVRALLRAAELIRELAGGRPLGAIIDHEPSPATARTIELDLDAMASRLGVAIPAREVKRRLKSLGVMVTAPSKSRMTLAPPSWRPDLNEPADIMEEVARVSGLADIPALLPLRPSKAGHPDRYRAIVATSRELMTGAGLTEAKTIAFIEPAENHRFTGLDGARPVRVTNPLSAELSELRVSLITGLAGALRFNLNRQAEAFHAFEIGKVFSAGASGAIEAERIAGISYGPYALGAIGSAGVKASFWTIKGIVETYLRTLGIGGIEVVRSDPARTPFLHPGRAAIITVEGKSLGYVGELHPAQARRLELSEACALFELDFQAIVFYGLSPRKAVEPPPRFPAIRRDLALVLDAAFPASTVVATVAKIESPWLESVEIFDVYQGAPIAADKKSVALAIRYRARDRTLTDEEVNRAHAALVEQAVKQLGAELRQ